MPRTGRPREFDVEAVVRRARDVFWKRGYAATSVQDLTESLELHRGSIYAAFGDKQALYRRALALYVREGERFLERTLDVDPLLPALRAALLRVGGSNAAPGRAPARQRGCLLGNSIAELVPSDRDVRRAARDACDGFVRVVGAALERAQQTGEIVTTSTPEAQARMLLLLWQGHALVTRTADDRAVYAAGVDAALDGLRADRRE